MLSVTFPPNLSLVPSYTQVQQFTQIVFAVCEIQYGDPTVFQYKVKIKKGGHIWKCTKCSSFIQYRANLRDFYLENSDVTHLHKVEDFKNCDQQKLKNHIKPIEFYFPDQVEPFRQFHAEDRNEFMEMMKTSIREKCPHPIQICMKEGEKSAKVHCLMHSAIAPLKQCGDFLEYELDDNIYRLIRFQRKHVHYQNTSNTDDVENSDKTGNENTIKKRRGEKRQPEVQNIQFIEAMKNIIEFSQALKLKVVHSRSEESGVGRKSRKRENKEEQRKKREKEIEREIDQNIEREKQKERAEDFQRQFYENNAIKIEEGQITTQGKMNESSEYIIITSKLMRYLAKSYGKAAYIVKQQLEQNELLPTYSVYTLNGFNHNFNSLCFAIVIMQNGNCAKIAEFIEVLFTIYQWKPEVFFTNKKDELSMQAMQVLKTKHYDIKFHCVQSSNKFQSSNTEIEECVSWIKMMNKGGSYLQNAIWSRINDSRNGFAHYRGPFAGLQFIRRPTNFFHSYSAKNVDRLSNLDLLLQNCQKLIRTMCKFNERWHSFRHSAVKGDQFICFPNLIKCRANMNERPFSSLMKQILKCGSLSVLHCQDSQFYVLEDESYPYIVSQINSFWKCECGYLQKSGIPCSHVLKVIELKKIKLISVIHKFWVVDFGVMRLYSQIDKMQETKMSVKMGNRKRFQMFTLD